MKKILMLLSVLAITLTACDKKIDTKTTTAPQAPTTMPAPATVGVAVNNVAVGNAIGADKKVQGAGTAIAANDTIYASVDTTGTGEATLKSRWTYVKDGKSTLVSEDTQRVSATGPATHEFHISKPDGWPKGDYQVEIFVNETPAGTRSFSVG